DPSRALLLTNTLSGDLERLRILALIANAASAKGSLEMAEKAYAQLPGERAKSHPAARRVWEGTHYETPDQAVPNLAKISDPIARNDALHSVASVWLSKKPEEFAKFADEASRTGDALWIRAMADTLV